MHRSRDAPLRLLFSLDLSFLPAALALLWSWLALHLRLLCFCLLIRVYNWILVHTHGAVRILRSVRCAPGWNAYSTLIDTSDYTREMSFNQHFKVFTICV